MINKRFFCKDTIKHDRVPARMTKVKWLIHSNIGRQFHEQFQKMFLTLRSIDKVRITFQAIHRSSTSQELSFRATQTNEGEGSKSANHHWGTKL